MVSMPLFVERLPVTSTSWPRRRLPASSLSRRTMAALGSWITAVTGSIRRSANVTTPRTRTLAPVAAERASAMEVRGTPGAGVGVGELVGAGVAVGAGVLLADGVGLGDGVGEGGGNETSAASRGCTR